MPSPSWLPLDDPAAEILESNWLFELKREPFRSRRSGQIHNYYVIHLADAVNVVALTPDRKLVMVRQFRAGSNQDSLETPGGLVDEGEDVFSAAARELKEETGFEGDPPQMLGMAWSNPSILSSRIATVLITNARRAAEPALDTEEEVDVELISAGRIPVMIRDGRINHALVVQGLLLWLVSEIPDQPLTNVPPDANWRQIHIQTILIWIAGIALVCGALANLGRIGLVGVSMGMSIVTILWLRHVDPERKCVLLRFRRLPGRPLVLHMLAWIGTLVLWIGLGIVAASLL